MVKARMALEAERDQAGQSLLDKYQLKAALQLGEMSHKKQIQGMWLGMLVMLGVIWLAVIYCCVPVNVN
ncbi:hypothetical protein [Alishewanella longhuensis]